ncbi:hypothetical protein IMZ48_47655 [Candidatus Bathyarchaeota archaeon]|nr:hypothetical protein [Candidatus Bathyarchaeota archaeon]
MEGAEGAEIAHHRFTNAIGDEDSRSLVHVTEYRLMCLRPMGVVGGLGASFLGKAKARP